MPIRICKICSKEFGNPKLWHSKAMTCCPEHSKLYEKIVKQRYKFNNPDKIKQSHKKWYYKKPREIIKRICKICGKEFTIVNSRDLTCSEECRKRNIRNNGNRNNKIWVKRHPDRRRKICHNYSMNNKEILREKAKQWRKKNPIRVRNKVKEWRKKNRPKRNAEALAQKNIKIPDKQLCEICNINLAKHRHHEDYNKPKEVKFLCVQCHNNIHHHGSSK